MQLSAQTIRLGATPRDKKEAIELAGIALVDAGYIERAYIQSMMGRELQSNTCLGRGIAIPHGMAPDRHLIKQTGVAVVQMPRGVEWNAEERVELVFAIAAKSDEHLPLLASLMDVLGDEALIERLSNTTDVGEIINAFNGPSYRLTPQEGALNGSFVNVKMGAPAGLHARPATRLIQVADQFQSDISIEFRQQHASAKAMVSLLKLGVPGGEIVRVWAEGVDAEMALATLKAEIEGGLGDGLSSEVLDVASPRFTPVSEGSFLTGIAASPGIAISPLHFLREDAVEVTDNFSSVNEELARFSAAVSQAQCELETMSSRVTGNASAIFEAQSALLKDFELRAEVENLIGDEHGAAWAWNSVVSSRADELGANSNARLAERSADLKDVGTRVLKFLGVTKNAAAFPDSPFILVAGDLTPSQTSALDPTKVLGICLVAGGPTSHTAILARSLRIPAVVGIGSEVFEITTNSNCILDAGAGRLYFQPTSADLEAVREFQAGAEQQRGQDFADRFRPALMRDGYRVEVVANIGEAGEGAKAIAGGAEGVGLLRTEIQFLGRDSAPTEQEQFEFLIEVTSALGGLPLIVRTLDIGGDKAVSYLNLVQEENPFLGVRGVRLTLRQPELFKTQLRAIFRASETGPIRILFPMVGTLEEWRATRNFAESVRLEMGVLQVDYGVMVEVPAAALMAQELAHEVDFFSVGTNDLTQYTLAIDRMHPVLGKESDPLHPAVLRLIDLTVRAAQEAGKWVGVCGGVTDEPLGALILTGLGVSELSTSIPTIPSVKAALRDANFEEARSLASRALKCGSAAEVRALGGIL